MYKDRAKRVLAVILAFCMAGSMPDINLLAAEVSNSQPVLFEELEKNEEGIAALADTSPGEPAGKISLADFAVTKPTALPAQVKTQIPEQSGSSKPVVTAPVIGLEISYNGTVLKQCAREDGTGGDYVVRVNKKETDTADLVVEGTGSYEGTILYPKVALGISIADTVVTTSWDNIRTEEPASASYRYEGRPILPEVEVKYGNPPVTLAKWDETAKTGDYKVEYGSNTNVKDGGVIRIIGMGTNYAGTKEVKFNITANAVESVYKIELASNSAVVYNKGAAAAFNGILPEFRIVNIKDNSIAVEKTNPDFTLNYEDNKNQTNGAATGKIKLSAGSSGNCTGTAVATTFEIKRADLNESYTGDNEIKVDVIGKTNYTGVKLTPEIEVTQGGGKLAQGTDYEAPVYGENTIAGKEAGTITITGKGNYTGTRVVKFDIKKFDLSTIEFPSKIGDQEYTGNPITIAGLGDTLTTKDGNMFSKDRDYRVQYENNINPGDAVVRFIATDTSPNCEGELVVKFVIYKSLGHSEIEIAPIADQPYTGQAIHPSVTVQDKKMDLAAERYQAEYANPDNAGDLFTDVGTHKFTVKGDGKYYRDKKEATFKISKRNMNSITAAFKEPVSGNTYLFNGTAWKPEVVLTVTDAAGKPVLLPSDHFNFSYIQADDTEEKDSDCINAGSYKVKIAPKAEFFDRYEGNPITLDYAIRAKALNAEASDYGVVLLLNDTEFVKTTYTGKDIEPKARVTDKKRGVDLPPEDYALTYSNNRKVGRATVTITGQRNYTGSITKDFEIAKRSLTADIVQIELIKKVYVYTGQKIIPTIKFIVDGEEMPSEEYDVKSEAVNVGDPGNFSISGTGGNYTGEIPYQAPDFEITPKSLSLDDSDITIEPIPNQAYDKNNPSRPIPKIRYNGKELQAGTDAEPKDFKVSYENNTAIDIGVTDENLMPKVTVTGQGNFTGEFTMTFHIRESINAAVITGIDENTVFTYTTQECKPQPSSVTLGGNSLIRGVDYEISYLNNINAGSAKVIITGIGNYGGVREFPFKINKAVVAKGGQFSITTGGSPAFTGSGTSPTLTIVYKPNSQVSYKLQEGIDYRSVNYEGNKEVNKAYNFNITPTGNFIAGGDGVLRLGTYKIQAKSIASEDILVSGHEGIDTSMLPVPNPRIVVKDTKRNADGSYAKDGVNPAEAFELTLGADYTIEFKGFDKPGMAVVTIKGTGNYTGTNKVEINISGALEKATAVFTNPDKQPDEYYYTGAAIVPKIKVIYGTDSSGKEIVLKENTDYTYSKDEIEKNLNVGEAKIHLTGKGPYAGSEIYMTFKIKPRPLNDSKIKIVMDNSVDPQRDGAGKYINVWPVPKLTLGKYELKEGTDYTLITEAECWQPSKLSKKSYNLTIKPVEGSNFTDPAVNKTYTVGSNFPVKIEFEGSDVPPYDKYETVYTGKEIEPTLRVFDIDTGEKLEKGKHFKVEYGDNVNAGRVAVVVSGLGEPENTDPNAVQYYGSKTVYFTIKPKSLKDADVTLTEPGEFIYTSKPIKPEPAVGWAGYHNTGLLEAGEDFKYEYKTNVDAGTGTVIVKGMDNFSDSREVAFTIKPKNIGDEDVTVDNIKDQVFINASIEPTPNIHWGDPYEQVTLAYTATKKDYQIIKYEAEGGDERRVNVDVGAVLMTIEGQGNYTGTRTIPFNIVKVNLSNVTMEYSKSEQYTRRQITPSVTMTYSSTDGKKKVTMTPEEWGYTISYGPNQLIGTKNGSITITPQADGNCIGDPIELRFDIVPRDLKDKAVQITYDGEKSIPTQYLTNLDKPCEPEVVITFTWNGEVYELKKDTDYRVTYKDNDKYGTASVIIDGMGNFSGKVEEKFRIALRLTDYIKGASIDDANMVYNGKSQYPTTVRKELSIEYYNIIKEGEDFEIVWDDDCVNAGEHTGKIIGINKYDGEIPLKFTIKQRDIAIASFEEIPDQLFTGSAIEPSVTVADPEVSGKEPLGADIYRITGYENNLEIGEATITIVAVESSNYKGTASVKFKIKPANLLGSYMEVTSVESPQAYTGKEIKPEFTISDTRRNPSGSARINEYYTLIEGLDYTVDYRNNIYPGLAQDNLPAVITVTGIGHYEGTLSKMFEIQADLGFAAIESIPIQKYTGEELRPKLKVTLGERELIEKFDYEAVYSDNIERGMASVVIRPVAGSSLYTGTNTASFEIRRDLTNANIILKDSSFTYTGNAIVPAATVVAGDLTLNQGVDYDIRYENNTNVGTATITVTGRADNGFDGSVHRTFTIVKRSITRCRFENVVDRIYNGTATSQNLIVTEGEKTLVMDQDYALAYAKNAQPGIATITVSGLGNYGGTKTIRYLINVTGMTQVSAKGAANSVTLSWLPAAGAEGYAIYSGGNKLIGKTTKLSYTHKDLDALTAYTYKVRPYASAEKTVYYGAFSDKVQARTSFKKPSITLKREKKGIRVSWKKIKGADGYEIYRSTKKTTGYKRIKTAKKASIVSYTNSRKLKKKTKYYYKIRAYKKVSANKVYSSYSSPKSIKTK